MGLAAWRFVAVCCWAALLSLVYALFVVVFCGALLSSCVEAAVHALAFHLLFGMLVWCLSATVCAAPARPPPRFYLAAEQVAALAHTVRPIDYWRLLDEIAMARRLPVYGDSAVELYGERVWRVHFCEQCGCFKPARCHHCSRCQCCQLRMDHHCPAVANCVHLCNQKAFVLILVYALLLCLYSAAAVAPHCAVWLADLDALSVERQVGAFVLGCVALAAAVGAALLAPFLYAQRLTVCVDVTRIEALFTDVGDASELADRRLNFTQVFGKHWWLWPLPTRSSLVDGTEIADDSSSDQTDSD